MNPPVVPGVISVSADVLTTLRFRTNRPPDKPAVTAPDDVGEMVVVNTCSVPGWTD